MRKSSPAPFAAGHYSALFVTRPIPADAALGMLPKGLDLVPQTLTPPGQHPLLLMFGHHTHVHPAFLKISGWSYHEFLTAVPWVRFPGGKLERSHMPRLYLDNVLMVLAGWLYAFPKLWGRIDSGTGSYAVRSLVSGRPLLSARWNGSGTRGPVEMFPLFRGVEPTFAQPFIQRFPPLPFIGSVMQFALGSATLEAAEGSITIDSEFLRGLPAGTLPFPPLTASPLGGFLIDVPWTLSLPRVGKREE